MVGVLDEEGVEWGAYHGLLPVAVPHPLVALSLILGLHPGLALLLSLIILLVGLLRPELCLLPKNERREREFGTLWKS